MPGGSPYGLTREGTGATPSPAAWPTQEVFGRTLTGSNPVSGGLAVLKSLQLMV